MAACAQPQLGACQWLGAWLGSVPGSTQRAFLESFLAVLGSKGTSLPGLTTGAEVLAGCVAAAQNLDHQQDNGEYMATPVTHQQ